MIMSREKKGNPSGQNRLILSALILSPLAKSATCIYKQETPANKNLPFLKFGKIGSCISGYLGFN